MRVYKNLCNKGFTLVELLVVIAIIAILFAVVLVAINPAQRFKDSRNSRRLADVKSIVEAATTYTADRRGAQLPDVSDYQCVGTKSADDFSAIPTGSTAVWKFDNSLNDAVPVDNLLTSNSTTYTTNSSGKFGEAIQLNGSTSSLVAADHAELDPASSALTLEGWIKLNQKIEPGAFDHHLPIFDKGNYRLQINSNSGKLEFDIQNSAASWNANEYTSAVADNVKGINAIVEFQDSLYAGTLTNAALSEGRILKQSGGVWSVFHDYANAAGSANALAVYNGKLYSGHLRKNPTDLAAVYVFDGTSWQNTNLGSVAGSADVLSLMRYRGKLYAGLGNLFDTSIWEYDGSSWRSSKSFLSSDAVAVYALAVFNGKLYAGTGGGTGPNPAHVFEFDGNVWSGSPVANFSKAGAYSLAEYQKELYIGLGGSGGTDGEIWKWTQSDGPSKVDPDATYTKGTYSLGVYNGDLYAGWSADTAIGEIRKLGDPLWTSRNSPSAAGWYSVTYGSGRFVAVAGSGTNRVMYSDDGINWTSTSVSGVDNNAVWYSVTYGASKFVAVANSGTNQVMTSSDGINWIQQTSPANNNWTDVTYGNNKFVAVANNGTGNRVMYSNNGDVWVEGNNTSAKGWLGVKYGNGLFVAVANSGSGSRVMTSSNGVDWSEVNGAPSNQWLSIAFGNGLFVAVANPNTGDRVMTSSNGTDWTIQTSPAYKWSEVTFGNGLFVAVANSGDGNRVMTSPDGINWILGASAANEGWNSVAYGEGVFAAVSSSGSPSRVMTYGSSWISPLATSTDEVRSLYPFQGKLYAATRGDDTADATIRSYGSNGYVGSQKTVWYPNSWYHLAGVYDGTNSKMDLMINGHLDATTNSGVPGTPTTNLKTLNIGSGYGSDPFYGILDNLAIYNNTALSADEVASHAGCYNLGQYLAPEYMGSLPIDPSSTVTDGTDTGYFISKDTGGVITITAPLTEITSSIPEIIKASR